MAGLVLRQMCGPELAGAGDRGRLLDAGSPGEPAHHWRSSTLIYEEFKAIVRQEGERRAQMRLELKELRLRVPIDREPFDTYVLRLHSDRLVHLLSHVEGESLPDPVRQDCIPHDSGALLYWIRWL